MALRVEMVSQNHESRPSPQETKKFGFLGRMATIGISLRSRHNRNSDNMNSKPHQNRIRTDSNNSATTMGSCSSTSTLLYLSSATLTKTSDILIGGIPSNEHSIANMAIGRDYSPSASSSRPLNAMQWMQNDCPKDVVPLILAFAGPQKIATIGKTNRFWRELIEQESTWRRLCEMLYKVGRIVAKTLLVCLERFLTSLGIASSPYLFSFLAEISGKRETIFPNPGRNTTSSIHVSPWIILASTLPSEKRL